jgi:hypothetical protein
LVCFLCAACVATGRGSRERRRSLPHVLLILYAVSCACVWLLVSGCPWDFVYSSQIRVATNRETFERETGEVPRNGTRRHSTGVTRSPRKSLVDGFDVWFDAFLATQNRVQTHSGIKIVHFTGHGNTSASLLLENDDGSSDVYPREHVQALLSSGIGSDVPLLCFALFCSVVLTVIFRAPPPSSNCCSLVHVTRKTSSLRRMRATNLAFPT